MKRFLLCPQDGGLHDIECDDHNVKMTYSEFDKSWTKPGGVCGKLHDHGNGLSIKTDGAEYRWDYCKAYYIFTMLEEYYKASGQDPYCRKFEVEEVK